MNAFPKIDMAEVTRLTRAGKLAEAMALLRGRENVAGSETAPVASTRLIARPPVSETGPERQPSGTRGPAAAGLRAAFAPLAHRMRALSEYSRKAPGFGGLRERAVVPIPEGARFEDRTFANRAGARDYKVYVPSGYRGQALPVVVMLHGCTQDPQDFAAGTRMNEVAEEQMFLVVYPHQPQSANAKGCWNWFNASEQRREGGEPSLIAGIALTTIEEFSADPARVYVAGLSAGGAAAAILATTHADVFAAAGVHSGLACGAARDMPSAFAAMAGTPGAGSGGDRRAAPTIVFHGDADRTVHVANGERVVAQARPAAGLREVIQDGTTPDGMSYTRTMGLDAAGKEIFEHWVLHGAGHAWSGGSADGSYTEPRGPDASRAMVRFFLGHVNAKASRVV